MSRNTEQKLQQSGQLPVMTPGDFFIDNLSIECPHITGDSNVYSIIKIFEAFVIYENLFSNHLTGFVRIVDNSGFLEFFPIIGEETLHFTGGTSGSKLKIQREGNNNKIQPDVISQSFRIISITNIESLGNTGFRYDLNFVSEEYINNMRENVQMAYKGSLGLIAQKVYQRFIQRDKNPKKLFIEPTKGIHEIAFPNFSPFQCMNYLSKNAISNNESSKGSLYTFYEQLNNGFRFESIESIMNREVQAVYGYGIKNASGEDMKYKYYNVNNLELISSFDALRSLEAGKFNSELILHDLIQQKITYGKYSYLDYPNKSKEGKKIKKLNNEFNTLGQIPIMTEKSDLNFDNKTSRVHYASSNEFQNSAFSRLDPSIKNNAIADTLLQRKTQMAHLSNVVIRASAHGLSNRHVGDIIIFNFPTGVENNANYHRFYSGEYIITSLRHKFTINSYEIDFECGKNGYGTRAKKQMAPNQTTTQ